jgi:hypothetical protein
MGAATGIAANTAVPELSSVKAIDCITLTVVKQWGCPSVVQLSLNVVSTAHSPPRFSGLLRMNTVASLFDVAVVPKFPVAQSNAALAV